jgi:hypothetical protein
VTVIVDVALVPAATVEELSADAKSEYDDPLEPEDDPPEPDELHPQKQRTSIATPRLMPQ